MENTNNIYNVTTGKPKVGGAVFRAPLGTSLPTDATSDLGEGFVGMGYCSDDGLKNSTNMSSEKVKAWGGDTVMNAQTEKSDEFKMTFIEGLNANVLAAVHGDKNVTGSIDSGMVVKVNSADLSEYIWVVDMIMRGDVLKRVVIPSGKITAIEEVTYDDSNAVGYGVTISAAADDDGNTHYEYLKKSAAAEALSSKGTDTKIAVKSDKEALT